MKKALSLALLLLSSAVFTGCGGCGGGFTGKTGGCPADNSNQYNLRAFIDTNEYLIEGTGSIHSTPTGDVFATGMYQSAYEGASTALTGETVHHHDVSMNLAAGAITVTQSVSTTTYKGNIVSMNKITEGVMVTCQTPLALAQITAVPTDAQVYYQSDVIGLECSDGSYVTNMMSLDDMGGGNAKLTVLSNTYASQDKERQNLEIYSIEVTPNMGIVSVQLEGSVTVDGTYFSLSSTSVVQN